MPSPMVMICDASSSGIVNPYSCCIASWISTNASESRPSCSKDRLGSSTTAASERPIRLTRMFLMSSNVNSCTGMRFLLLGRKARELGSGKRPEARELLGCGLAAGFEEQVGEMELPPGRGAESRRDRHVRERRMPLARGELREVHHLEQRVEHPRARLALGLLGRRLTRPRRQRVAADQ